jgi:hypothetical protein
MAGSFSLWLFGVSMAARALGGMLGMAGGIFIVPLLTVFGHVEIHTAVGASIVFRHCLLVRRSSTVPEESPDQYPAGDRARNGNDNGRFNRSISCRNRTSVVSVASICRSSLSFRPIDAGETP